MMKKLYILLAALAALASCLKEPIDNTPVSGESQTITFEAKAPRTSISKDTKTTLVDHSLVNWSNGDQVKVGFFPVTGGNKNTRNNKNGIFTSTFAESTASSAFFKISGWSWDAGNSEKETDYRTDGLAVYPSSATVYSKRSGNYSPASTEVSYDLPSEQLALLNSFQSDVNFSYARVNKSDFSANKASLSFLNACSLVKISLPESATGVAMVEVSSKTGTPLTGKFGLGYDDLGGYNQDDPWSVSKNGLLNFTAVSGNGEVLLYAENGTSLVAGGTYYLVVWPGTHSSGLSFTFTNLEGATCVKEVTQSVTFERAGIESFNFVSEISFKKEPSLEVNTNTLNLNAANGKAEFTVLANYDWTVTDNASWLSVSPSSGSSSLQAATVTVTAENNTDYTSSRSAVITVTAGGLTQTSNVTHAAADKPKFSVALNPIAQASDLKDGGKYIFRAATGNGSGGINSYNYFWKVDANGTLFHEYLNGSSSWYSDYTWGNRSLEQVFEYTRTGDDGVKDSGYNSKSAGYWKSLSTGKYLNADLKFEAENISSAQKMAMANKWGSETASGIDFYKHGTTSTLTTGSAATNSFYWGTTGDTYRKWTIYEVTQL